ncbi:MAG TPA: acetamidase/formamidase family protein [Candidatus Limnocylindrales bacterium]|nr:acetamidase/formamidase family protein [Candidatus Limnocylindrales bacterium]
MSNNESSETVFVNTFNNGVLDPSQPMLGPVRNGGYIVANTAPGCWGPMITPAIRGGHEVTQPVYVEGAEIGDAIAIHIKSIVISSSVTASGTDQCIPGRFLGDPYVAGQCPGCGILYPETNLEGIGAQAVRCRECGGEATPFVFDHGYTIAFDENRQIGVTLPREAAERAARDARSLMAIPDFSSQNPVVAFAPSDMPGVVTRLRPFLGQLGTTPSHPMPDSHNAGDFGSFLIGAPHEYAMTAEELKEHCTDGHMDINRVRAGAVVIFPVKVPGGGVYLGDMHALQGDGEIAGHTCDVAGIATLKVEVLKGLKIQGPILLPVWEDLPYLAKPHTCEEMDLARSYAKTWGFEEVEVTVPISVVGTGPDLNAATSNALERAGALLNISVSEVKNRITINGAVEIGRLPGVVTTTFLVPIAKIKETALADLVIKQYRQCCCS